MVLYRDEFTLSLSVRKTWKEEQFLSSISSQLKLLQWKTKTIIQAYFLLLRYPVPLHSEKREILDNHSITSLPQQFSQIDPGTWATVWPTIYPTFTKSIYVGLHY